MIQILSNKHLKTCSETFKQAKFRLESIDLAELETLVSGREKQFIQRYLNLTEQDRFLSFKYRKRQIEWLGGRLAAKKAISALLADSEINSFNPDLWIDATPEGRPFLNSENVDLPIDISISHSGNLAAALAVDAGTCGLDIQKITTTITKVKSRFASAAEEAIIRQVACLKNHPAEAKLALLWAAKEAFRKAVIIKPVLGFLEISLDRLDGTIEKGFTADFSCSRPKEAKHLKAFFTLSSEFAVAITMLL